MMYFRLIFVFCLLVYFSPKYLSANQSPTIISLGPNCQPAYRLNQCNLRTIAYPFDWIWATDIQVATKAINEDFDKWLDKKFLSYTVGWIYNSYYNVRFNHDFPTELVLNPESKTPKEGSRIHKSNYLDYLPQVQKKYARRINRLKKALNGTDPVIFLSTYTSPIAAYNFVSVIKSKYPNLHFLLVVVNPGVSVGLPFVKENYTYGDAGTSEGDWSTENIKVYYSYHLESEDIDHYNMGWWRQEEWANIFNQLGLLKPLKP